MEAALDGDRDAELPVGNEAAPRGGVGVGRNGRGIGVEVIYEEESKKEDDGESLDDGGPRRDGGIERLHEISQLNGQVLPGPYLFFIFITFSLMLSNRVPVPTARGNV